MYLHIDGNKTFPNSQQKLLRHVLTSLLAYHLTAKTTTCTLSSYLFPQDGFGLSAESLLLPVITPPPLGKLGLLGFLVLRDAELLVRVALRVGTERPSGLRNVHLKTKVFGHEENNARRRSMFHKWYLPWTAMISLL